MHMSKFKSGIRTNAAAYWDLWKAGVFHPHIPAFVAKYYRSKHLSYAKYVKSSFVTRYKSLKSKSPWNNKP